MVLVANRDLRTCDRPDQPLMNQVLTHGGNSMRTVASIDYCKVLATYRKAAVGLIALLSGLLTVPSVLAQATLDETITQLLKTQGGFPCSSLRNGDTSTYPAIFGPQLRAICANSGDQGLGGSGSLGGGAVSTQTLPILQARALDIDDDQVAQGIAIPIMVADLGNTALSTGVSSRRLPITWFADLTFEKLDRDKTTFGDEYTSGNWNLFGGANYSVSDLSSVGVALHLNRWKADYVDRGGFQVDGIGLIGFGSLATRGGFAINANLSYRQNETDRSRFTAIGGSPPGLASGVVDGSYSGREYSAHVELARAFNVINLKIEPVIGLSYSESSYDSYDEKGRFEGGRIAQDSDPNKRNAFVPGVPTGLELSFDHQRVTSLQSAVGVRLRRAPQSTGATIMPHVVLAWHHEFKDDPRHVDVRFQQDNRPSPIRFRLTSDAPDANFLTLGGGVTIRMRKRIEPYASFKILLGHKFYDGYAVSIGLNARFD